ncbi:MAG: hypothetical protein RBU30_12060 [Polyangia bacterium]|jgi:Ca2+/Na+ antiporter|nr:hypothetical protein [Polyangia bacterium]
MEFLASHLDLWKLIGFGMAVVVFTRYFLTTGVSWLADNTTMSPKLKGKLLGFSTSVPELVATVSTAAMGLLGAGLWNIASSNIINCFLFAAAMLWYRQGGRLMKRKFVDEVSFAVSAIGLPIFLSVSAGLERSPYTAIALVGVFVLYLYLDGILNRHVRIEYAEETESIAGNHSVASAIGMMLVGILGISVSGYFLGHTAERVVNNLGMPEWGVGWILGFLTSLPELTSFFAVFGEAKQRKEKSDASMQANLDNLAASNMANLGIIFPIGIVVFLLSVSL